MPRRHPGVVWLAVAAILSLARASRSQEVEPTSDESSEENDRQSSMDWSVEEGRDDPDDSDSEGGSLEARDLGDAVGETGTADQDHEILLEGPLGGPPPEPLATWAHPRVYALRYRRFELIPRFGFSMNDQFVSHFGFGGQLNWYITEVLAIGIEGQWFYWNPESDINYYTSRSFRVSVPINEYWMGWYLNFHYVPMYGKFAIFNRWIWHWDVFVSGGLGVTLTRPIAVVDAEFRDFSDYSHWNPNITFSIAIGGRTFLTRWLAVFAELRMYGFPQPLEERRIAPLGDCTTSDGCANWAEQRANPNTWLDEDGEFAVNVMAQIGLSIFLPPTFEYRLPL